MKFFLILCMTLFALPGFADELRTSLIGSTTHNSNVYGSSNGEQDDLITQAGVILELRSDDEQQLDYLVSYRGNYEAYADESDANAAEHRQRIRLRYDFDRKTQITFNQRYRRISNLQFDRDDFQFDDSGIGINQNRYGRLDLDLAVRHQLNRRWAISGTLMHDDIDFKRNIDRSDSSATGVEVGLNYLLSDRHTFGIGTRYTSQDFDAADSRLGAESDYTTVYASWDYAIARNLSLELRAGPTWVDTTQDRRNFASARRIVGSSQNGDLFAASFNACNPGLGQTAPIASNCSFTSSIAPPVSVTDLGSRDQFALDLSTADLDQDESTVFGHLRLISQQNEWQYSLGYTRQQSASAGEALATSLDQIAITVDYAPADQRWAAYSELRWDNRSAISDALVIDYTVTSGANGTAVRDQAFVTTRGSGSDRDSFTGLVGVEYLVLPQLRVAVEGRFRRGDQPRGSTGNDQTDRYLLALTLRYDFQPQRF